MAVRKSAPASSARKAAAKPPAERLAPREKPASGVSDSNRLLREAAWSRMFGRTESKNPFTR